MKPVFENGFVRSLCPGCSAVVAFEYRSEDREFGEVRGKTADDGSTTAHKLLRCPVCYRPGVATISVRDRYVKARLLSFWPPARYVQRLPKGTPEAIEREIREAEDCMLVSAWRGAAALFRSALEKTLKVNGYDEPNLAKKIDAAADDGVITAPRKIRAHELIRTLGNDVLHGEWREVSQEEAEQSDEYVARVVHDFYDERPTVETILKSKGRLK